jgi:hypothetical protein
MKNPRPFLPGTLRRKTLVITYGQPFLPESYKDAHEMTAALSAWMEERAALKRVPRLPG